MKKTIVITGSTDGIGKGTALKLANEGHEIYIHGRNPDKLKDVVSEIIKASKNENINGFVADFSDLEAVQQMAEQVKGKLSKIDVLINNAGVYKSRTQQNLEGLDMRMAVNYLAPYILTNELLPLLKEGDVPRIINLSSAGQSPVIYSVLKGNARQAEGQTYAQSKLALTMWSFYLAKKHPEIAVLAVNPGSLLNTKMVKETFGNHWSPAEKGIDILYSLAVSEDFEGLSGKYFDNDKGSFGQAHSDAYAESKINRLIEETDEILLNKHLYQKTQ